MRIVFLVDFLPTKEKIGGGLQNQFARLAKSLYDQGEDIIVICKSKNINYDHYPFPIIEAHITYREKSFYRFINALTLHCFAYSLKQIFEARAVAREYNKIPGVDIIQSSNYQFLGLFIHPIHARLIVFAASYHPLWSKTKGTSNTPDNRLTSFLEGIQYKRAGAVYAASAHLAAILERKYKRQIDILPSPIPDASTEENLDWYQEHLGNKKYILYFGDIIKRKGIFTLADAMQEVWKKAPDVLLVLAGADKVVNGRSGIASFQEIVKTNKEKVIYAGEINHPSLFPVIKNAAFVVLPSVEDNCPNTMLEAMAVGKAVLGTIGSSLDEFYPSSCLDLLVRRENSTFLAEKILNLWGSSQERLDEYGTQCRGFIQTRHNLNQAAQALKAYYEKQTSSH